MRNAHLIMAISMLATACHEASESRTAVGAPAVSSGALEAASGSDRSDARQTPTVRKRMQDHFEKALALKSAIEKGDIDASKSAAGWLSSTPWTPHLRPDWQPYMTAMQNAATAARDAKDLDTAARALGRAGRTCANCHEDVGGPKTTTEPLPPPSPGDLSPNPHAWAADRMWEGLIAPSSAIWIQGAGTLSSAIFRSPGGSAGDAQTKTNLLESKVHALGRVAMAAEAQQRSAIYADLVLTCAACHAAAGVVLR